MKVPKKHQLYIEFTDDTALVCTVRCTGMVAFHDGEYDNKYYIWQKPSPLRAV